MQTEDLTAVTGFSTKPVVPNAPFISISMDEVAEMCHFDIENGFTADLNIIVMLERNGERNPSWLAFKYVDYSGYEPVTYEISWGDLLVKIKAVAARIQQISKREDRIAILCPQGLEYIVAFFGAIYAGNVAVPLFEPGELGHTDRLVSVLEDCKPTVLLTSTSSAESVRAFVRNKPAKERPRILAVDAVPDDVSMLWWRPEDLHNDKIAYLQYTSGSTRIPTGVSISHEAVCVNVFQIATTYDIDNTWSGVTWLPLFHDMGLITMMVPAIVGGRITILSPSAFVRKPYRWIELMNEEGKADNITATITAAPNFAYEHTAARGLPKDGAELNLSKLVLLNGSEPISVAAVRKFTEAFKPYGLPETAIKPCYGMAEATLFVSSTPIDKGAKVEYVDRDKLNNGEVVFVGKDAENSTPQISCGLVSVFQWAIIVDPETEEELSDDKVGEIWLIGSNIGTDYWNKPDETEYTFNAQVKKPLAEKSRLDAVPALLDKKWLRTGDLGFFHEGEIYVTGRIKDLVIISGRNHYPTDLEVTAQEASEAIRTGYVAAFTVPANELPEEVKRDHNLSFDKDDNSEQLILIGERASGTSKMEFKDILESVKIAIATKHGVGVCDLQLVPAGAIPRTSSGKLARRACRTEYLNGLIRGTTNYKGNS